MSTTILALDASTEACSCALTMAGEVIEHFEIMPRRHSQELLPMIRNMLQQHGLDYKDLDALAFGAGPGSFTGLRIAAGITQGIAFGADLPVIPVSGLAALALQAWRLSGYERIFSCLDARIGELYWAVYELQDGVPQLIGEEHVQKPEDIRLHEPLLEYYAAGNGLALRSSMPEHLRSRFHGQAPELLPRAGDIARIAVDYFRQGISIAAEDINPTYLRNQVTQN